MCNNTTNTNEEKSMFIYIDGPFENLELGKKDALEYVVSVVDDLGCVLKKYTTRSEKAANNWATKLSNNRGGIEVRSFCD